MNKIYLLILIIFFTGCTTLTYVKKDKIKPVVDSIEIPKINSSEFIDEDLDLLISFEDNNKEYNKSNDKNNNQEKKNDNKNTNIINSENTKNNDKNKNEMNNNINDTNIYNNLDKKKTAKDDNLIIQENTSKQIDVDENQIFTISMKYSGWTIKTINPKLIKLIKRENSEKNTMFQFQSTVPGTIEIIFTRYNADSNTLWRQAYIVNINPKSLFLIDEEGSTIEQNKKDEENIDSEIIYDDFLNNKKNEKEDNKKDKKDKNKNAEDFNYKKNIAYQFYNQQKYKEAMDIYQSLIKENKGDGEIFYYMGKIEQNNSKPDKANEYFINVLESNDKIFYNDALKELIKNLKTQKKYLDAINIFYKYGLKDNMDPRGAEELNILLADIYFNMDDFNNSSSEYRRFMSRYPDSKDYVKALFYLAYSLEKLAVDPDFDEAYRIYKIIVNNYPESKYSDMSKKRILHLERHYLKIN